MTTNKTPTTKQTTFWHLGSEHEEKRKKQEQQYIDNKHQQPVGIMALNMRKRIKTRTTKISTTNTNKTKTTKTTKQQNLLASWQ